MAITNKYILFANESSANKLTEEQYENLSETNTGFLSGSPIVSKDVNTVLYANSLIANTIANFIQVHDDKDTANLDISTTVSNMTTYFRNALRSYIQDNPVYLYSNKDYGWTFKDNPTSITKLARLVSVNSNVVYIDNMTTNLGYDDSSAFSIRNTSTSLLTSILPQNYNLDEKVNYYVGYSNAGVDDEDYHFADGYFDNFHLGTSEWDSKVNTNALVDRYNKCSFECLTSNDATGQYVSDVEVNINDYGIYEVQAVSKTNIQSKRVFTTQFTFLDYDSGLENNTITKYFTDGNNRMFASNDASDYTYVAFNRSTKKLIVSSDGNHGDSVWFKVYCIRKFTSTEVQTKDSDLPTIN